MAFSEHIYSTQLKFGNARAARVRERQPYGVLLLSRRSEKSNFRRIAINLFFAVAIIGSNELIFFKFFLSREG
jgi:hypothetical protein